MPSMPVTAQHVAAKAVIENSAGEVLILRMRSGRYGFPGGKLNVGEPFLEALHREIDEETGLVITVGEAFFASEWFPIVKGVQTQIVGVFLACKTAGQVVRLSTEHDHHQWIRPEEFGSYDFMPPEEQVLPVWLARRRRG